jgi:flagellin
VSTNLTFGSNSLGVQKNLERSAKAAESAFQRLSTGLRINDAGDDAAGLSIAESLKSKRLIYTKGVENLNDGISLLTIAEEAVEALTAVTERLVELAEEASTGTISRTQRVTLDQEAQALKEEYARIVQSAEYNGRKLFDASFGRLSLQGGDGESGQITNVLGGAIGVGSFTQINSLSVSNTNVEDVVVGDLNNDGIDDLVGLAFGGVASRISVRLGNEDGSFQVANEYTGHFVGAVKLADANNDGNLDIFSVGAGSFQIRLGDGEGGFGAITSIGTGLSVAHEIDIGDLNGDGVLDVVAVGTVTRQTGSYPTYYYYNDSKTSVLLGNGSGGFGAANILTDATDTYDQNSPYADNSTVGVTLGDINGDGNLDILSGVTDGNVKIRLGNGSGTSFTTSTLSTGFSVSELQLGDLDSDGDLDLVTANEVRDVYGVSSAPKVMTFLGNGQGTLTLSGTFDTSGLVGVESDIELADFNGDGNLDVISSETGSAVIRLGQGNGNLSSATSISNTSHEFAIGDFNRDGAIDIATGSSSSAIHILHANVTSGIAPLVDFSLRTRSDANQALSKFNSKLDQLEVQTGVIAAFQERVDIGKGFLEVAAENFAAAESRIRDTDVAEDSSIIAKFNIIKKTASAVLIQANLQPARVLKLLDPDS